MIAQRSGDADEDRIRLGQPGKISGHVESSSRDHVRDKFISQMLEIILPAFEGLDLGRIDVESEDGKPGAMKRRQQRQADVSQPHDADAGGFGIDPVQDIHRRTMYRKEDPYVHSRPGSGLNLNVQFNRGVRGDRREEPRKARFQTSSLRLSPRPPRTPRLSSTLEIDSPRDFLRTLK